MKRLAIFAFGIIAFMSGADARPLKHADKNFGHAQAKPIKYKVKTGDDSDRLISMSWDWDQPKHTSSSDNDAADEARSNLPSLTGGGQPSIAAVAPPKVNFANSYETGSIVIDTAGRRLYYVLSSTSAYSYPIAVGKQGFTWTGTEKITRKVAWPEWIPPAEMRARKAGLPERMAGGVRNPLGAMALYLGNTLYRIHGTNDVSSIGTAASSGCIRMTNGNVVHLAGLAGVGTTVHVVRALPAGMARAAKADTTAG